MPGAEVSLFSELRSAGGEVKVDVLVFESSPKCSMKRLLANPNQGVIAHSLEHEKETSALRQRVVSR